MIEAIVEMVREWGWGFPLQHFGIDQPRSDIRFVDTGIGSVLRHVPRKKSFRRRCFTLASEA